MPFPNYPSGYQNQNQYGAQQQQNSFGNQNQGFSSLRPQPPQPYVPGKMIADPSEIVVGEVPTSGDIALFMMKDLTAIYAKAWNSQGTIDTVRYIPEKPARQQQASDMSGIEAAFQAISERLDKIEKAVNRKPHYNKPRPQQEKKED